MVINVPAGNYNLTLEDSAFVLNTSNIYLQCQTSGGAINIILPKISTFGNTWGFKVYVNDVDNMAGTNQITVTINASDKIYGVSSPVVFNQNGSSAIFEIVGQNSWTMNTSVGSYISSQYAGVYNVSSSSLTSLPPIPFNAVKIDASSNSLTSLPSLAGLSLLKILNVSNNQLTSLPSLSELVSLKQINLGSNDFVAFSSSLSALTELQVFNMDSCALLTSFTSSFIGLTKLITISFSHGALSTATVNAILADAVLAQPTITNAVSLILDAGSNGAPSGQGIIDKATLNGLGWTVTTN